MPLIHKFQCALSGFAGAPGVNTFYALAPSQGLGNGASVDDFAQQLKAMYEALKSYLAPPLTVSGPTSCDVLDIETGELSTRLPVATPWTVVQSTGTSETSRATMAKHRYITDRVHRGRFLQGGIFFGPLDDAAISASGTINSTYDTAVATAYGGLLDVLGDLRLAVYSGKKPATDNRPASAGTFGYVQSVGVMPVPAVLRSRRG